MEIREWTIDEVIGELARVSLVSDPANGEEFMFFSAEKQHFKSIDTDRHIVTGLILRPDQKISRRDPNSGEQYFGFFSKETVRKAAEIFFKSGSNLNKTNLEHQYSVDGIYMFESWIVENPDVDKAAALGFKDVKAGDWYGTMKIENEAVWDQYIKSGIVKGFSIEARLNEEPRHEVLSVIDSILNSEFKDSVKLNLINEIVK